MLSITTTTTAIITTATATTTVLLLLMIGVVAVAELLLHLQKQQLILHVLLPLMLLVSKVVCVTVTILFYCELDPWSSYYDREIPKSIVIYWGYWCFFNERGMRYEPIDPISFLYQPERGPKREYQNIVTLFKRCRITVVIRSFGTLAKNP